MVGLCIGIVAIGFAAWFEILRRNSPKMPGCGSDVGKRDDDGAGLSTTPGPSPSPTAPADDDKFFADHEDCYSQCAFPGVQMSDFSVWWMAVPFFLVGTGECLCNIPIYECCYSQTPPAYRSMAQAVFLLVTAVGSMLTAAFTTALSQYVTDNLDDGHLE